MRSNDKGSVAGGAFLFLLAVVIVGTVGYHIVKPVL